MFTWPLGLLFFMEVTKLWIIIAQSSLDTGILYTSAWNQVAVFKVSKGKDVFLEAFEAFQDSTNMVTLKM